MLSSDIGNLASMVGLKIGEVDPNQVYQILVQSEVVLKPVVFHNYKTKNYSKPVNLLDYFDVSLKEASSSDPDSIQQRDRFLQMVDQFSKSSLMKTDQDRNTTILSIRIRTDDPRLSADIANNLISSLDYYVRTQRKSKASRAANLY